MCALENPPEDSLGALEEDGPALGGHTLDNQGDPPLWFPF